ncbi:hypothetical protein DV738_g3306, partial [Chaetothyriales sp. CBS 135597]
MDCIASALKPIKAIFWGEGAMARLGVPIVWEHYMFVIEDADFATAVQQLQAAGFQDCPWSYGSREPEFYKIRSIEHIYHEIVSNYSNLDRVAVRFRFPAAEPTATQTQKIVLLPSSYAHIRPSSPGLTSDGSILYPDAPLLLLSFVKTAVREPCDDLWKWNLRMWAVSYVYGELMLSDDVLDSCDDEAAKTWFNEVIRRFNGGVDQVTRTKKLGRQGHNFVGEVPA